MEAFASAAVWSICTIRSLNILFEKECISFWVIAPEGFDMYKSVEIKKNNVRWMRATRLIIILVISNVGMYLKINIKGFPTHYV